LDHALFKFKQFLHIFLEELNSGT